MSTQQIPANTNILVIGGGPSGSFAAAALAREGHEVTLLERDHFPRYHIGESMLPSCRPFMRFIGVEEKVKNFGFCVKVGAALKFDQKKREGYTDFINPDPEHAAWNVTRADFDEILLRNASENNVKVFEGVSVNALKFSPTNDKQPVAAEWKSDDGKTGTINFNWLVDASGRTGIMSTKYLKNRKFNKALRSVAYWGYWTGANMYAPGTSRENATWLEALTDESGWAWFIPLAGKVSVGIVLKEEAAKAKKAAFTGPNANADFYHAQLKLVPGVTNLLGSAKFTTEVMSAGDYSYSSNQHAGPHYRIVGDAGAFIDPFFSSGVHLAFGSGLNAAATISASIRGDCTEEEAISFHTQKTSTSYTRFLLVVLSAYRQITHQSVAVLADVDEDNYDRAFDFIRPVIQGKSDTDPTITEDMLQSTMDFCEHALGLTDPEMHEDVAKKVDPSLLADDAPLMSVKDAKALAGDDEDVEMVLRRVNSRKALEPLNWQPNFRGETFHNLYIRLERGSLGLSRAEVAPTVEV
ncbi:Radh flavin-dependent halogenase [Mycena sanguinolenta]|uniref:Radh flavin-dependent halogenase n=1 Tax=Mycena sanguinolenta TaxID=230812 RepID=A0A8H6Y3J1_9AGAR|nr:Radh flavin-dependent halogenase [Mycena sanguinolenta]